MGMLRETNSYINAQFLPSGSLLRWDLAPVLKFLGLRV